MMTIPATSPRLSARTPPRVLRRVLLLAIALAAAASLLLAAPASATEASSEDPGDSSSAVEEEVGEAEATEGGDAEEGGEAAEGEGDGKLTISDNPHDQFGLVLFGLGGLAGLFALYNAANQLKGKRPAADGRIRWR